jgi:signal transduction histidine kinase
MTQVAKILNIAECTDQVRSIQAALRRDGHRISMATSGESLAAMETEPYDLALVDITMPTINVFDVVARLTDSGVPIVAHGDAQRAPADGVPLRSQALALGCVGYVPEDTSEDDLVAQIEAYLGDRRDELEDQGDRIRALQVFGRAHTARLQRALGEAQGRLEEWRGFQRTVVHEMKTAVAQMMLTVELMDRGIDQDAISHLCDDLDALRRHIEDLTVFSGKSCLPIYPKPLDLTGLVEEYAEHHRAICSHCTLGAQVEGEPVVVEVDERRLRQVLDNLVSNAHKFVPPEREPRIELGVAVQDGHAVMTVEDNGIGVPPHQRERIFEPYVRLESDVSARGLGIGLAVVREILEAHDGDVVCETNGGYGTRFEVRLPRNGSREGAA